MTQQTASTGISGPSAPPASVNCANHLARSISSRVEAAATIAACLTAWRADGDAEWKAIATNVFAWFLGRNDLSIALVDPETGSCRDGLHPDRANENRGGESVVSYLLGLADIRQLARVNVSADTASGASRHRRLSSHSPSSEPRTSCRKPLPASAGALSAPRPRASDCTPVQADDRTTRPQPDRQDPRQPYRRARSRTRPEVAASLLADVLENFQGRHRNLLETFEARADVMEQALAAHGAFPRSSAN